MIWSHPHWAAVFKRSKKAEKTWNTVDIWSWLISMCGLKSWSSLMSPVRGLWRGADQLALRLPSAYLSGMQGWNPKSCCVWTRGRLDVPQHTEASVSLCLQCTPGGSDQKGDLIPHPAANICPHLWQPTFQISHCQVKYPLWRALTGQDCTDLYFKQLNISLWGKGNDQTRHGGFRISKTLNRNGINIIKRLATCLQMNDQTN